MKKQPTIGAKGTDKTGVPRPSQKVNYKQRPVNYSKSNIPVSSTHIKRDKKCASCYIDRLLNQLYLNKAKDDNNIILLDEKNLFFKFKDFNLLFNN